MSGKEVTESSGDGTHTHPTPKAIRSELILQYRKMYELTNKVCRETCTRDFGCCDPIYCRVVMAHARVWWGKRLSPTDHPRLPLMGPGGCIAPPHMRPVCTLYICHVSPLEKPADFPWLEEYYALRNRLICLEGLPR